MKKCIVIVVGLLICTLALANSATAKSPGTIFEVQKKLLMLGYSPGPADGMMGRRTEEAIRHFQHDNGLPPTGRVDRHTEEIIMRAHLPQPKAVNHRQPVPGPASHSPFNQQIAELQHLLAGFGYHPGPADGVMGGRTHEALRLFQRDHHLPVTGELDKRTREALNRR